jgi:hypothetical protein
VHQQRAYVGGGLQTGAALVVVCLPVMTLPPCSTAPTVLTVVWLASVVSGLPLCSRAVSGVSQHVCVCLRPVLASHAPSPTATAAAACRGLGRVPIAGWSYGGVGPERGLRGGGRRGILLLHIISVRPSKQPLMVRTFLKVCTELGSSFLFLQEQINDIIIRDDEMHMFRTGLMLHMFSAMCARYICTLHPER